MLLRSISAVLCLTIMQAPAEATGKQLKIAYVEWAEAVVATNILKLALEEKGYEVKIIPLAAAAMWQAVATGDADVTVAGWLPTSHGAYYEKLKNRVDLVAINLKGAKLGLAVPAYSPLNSIEDLATKAAEVDNKVIGIDPGAGIMRRAEIAIKEYGLPVKLLDGSDATMTSSLKDAVRQKKGIVVTAWTPHWMFARYELKYLNDPKKAFGAEEDVYTVARKGLKEDAPDAYSVLKNFKLSVAEEEAVMSENEDKTAKPEQTAAKWIANNRAKVSDWLK